MSLRVGVLLVGLCAATSVAAAATTGASPEIVEHRESFVVDATRAATLHRQLNRHGAQGLDGRAHAGLTSSRLEARYALDPSQSQCTLTHLHVRLEVTIHLPAWQPAGKPVAGTEAYWQATLKALERHEDGHRRHAVAAAHELLERLQTLPPMPNCRVLDAAAQRARGRALGRLHARDNLYDLATDFGRAAPRSTGD